MLFQPIRASWRVSAAVQIVAASLLLPVTIRIASAQTVSQPIIRQAGGISLTIKLPADGPHTGAANDLTLHISAIDVTAMLTPDALVSAALSMPSMSGMTMAQPITAPGAAAGDYRISVIFPHAGDYQLEVRVTTSGKKVVKASFPLKAVPDTVTGTDAKSDTAMSVMMSTVAGIPHTQQASGTSWQPASTPMYGVHIMLGDWMVMTHYNVSLNYDRQEGPRGGYQYGSTNWLMVMADRPVGRDDLELRTMLTLEPLTVTPRGYPLLFQSGEQYDGKPIVDRQHPHDLFMEIAGRYTHPTSKDSAVFVYAAPAGEPALGPTAFMHRLSAFDIPDAPITHHWMDSTHIDFGVLTAGAWKRNLQLEASYFTGREPDQYRYDLSPMHPDSFSGRLSYNPNSNWNTQVSYGYIHSPEALRPGEDIRRTTASTSYTLPRKRGGWWSTTVGFGNNSSIGINSSAVLVESELNLADRNSFFSRFEYVNKLGEELALTPADKGFPIRELTLGYVRDITPDRPYQTGIGAAITFNAFPSSLDSLYGTAPLGFWLFVRIRPAPMRHM